MYHSEVAKRHALVAQLDERYEREICIRYNKRDTAGDKVPRSNEQFDLQLEMVA